MASTAKFLRPFRQSIALFTSPNASICQPRPFFNAKLEYLKSLRKELDPLIRYSSSNFPFRSFTERKCFQNFYTRGRKCIQGTILGATVVFGSVSFRRHASYAMDGGSFIDDDHVDFGTLDEEEERRHAFWTVARKLWVPIFFSLTVLTNLDYPLILIATKVILFLLSTKPSPLSVYIFVDQLCHHSMRQEPHLYRQKSLYARKVEVQDYKLLCLARVELRDEEFTLLGILGGWWVLPTSFTSHAELSAFRNRSLKHYSSSDLN